MPSRDRTLTLTRLVVAAALVVAIAAVTPGPTPVGAVTVATINPTLSGGHIGILGASYGPA